MPTNQPRPTPLDLPILDPDSLEDDEPVDEVRTVLITGASGNIGRKLAAAWVDRYDLVLVDQRVDPEFPDLIPADLSVWDESWVDLCDEADVIIHLAGNPSEFATWPELVKPNLDAVSNILLAAVHAGVERVVFASSNHVMGGYRVPGRIGPIHEDLAPLPGNDYGASKLVGERLGQAAVTAFGLTFLALRIGWVQPGANEPQDLDPALGDTSIWLSNRDLIQLFTRAIEAELEPGSFHTLNGLSNNKGTRWSLEAAKRLLDFTPEDGLGMD